MRLTAAQLDAIYGDIPVGTTATTRAGERATVVAVDEDKQLTLDFGNATLAKYYPNEVTLDAQSSIEQHSKWQTTGAELHVATVDYPELEDILSQPPPAISVAASKTVVGYGADQFVNDLIGGGSTNIGETCPNCNGDGFIDTGAATYTNECPTCNGSGQVDPTYHSSAKVENCPNCHSAHVFVSGGKARPGTKGQQMCGNCFHSWDKTASKTAARAQSPKHEQYRAFDGCYAEEGQESATCPHHQKYRAFSGDYYTPPKTSSKTATRHLTLTGPHAGQPICGAPMDSADQNVHAAYAPEAMLSDPATCAACRAAWIGEDDPTKAPDTNQGQLFASRKLAWNIEDVRKALDVGWYDQPGVDGIKVDHFSASALTQVFDALSAENQAKLLALPIEKAVDVAFKLINRQKNSSYTGAATAEMCKKCGEAPATGQYKINGYPGGPYGLCDECADNIRSREGLESVASYEPDVDEIGRGFDDARKGLKPQEDGAKYRRGYQMALDAKVNGEPLVPTTAAGLDPGQDNWDDFDWINYSRGWDDGEAGKDISSEPDHGGPYLDGYHDGQLCSQSSVASRTRPDFLARG